MFSPCGVMLSLGLGMPLWRLSGPVLCPSLPLTSSLSHMTVNENNQQWIMCVDEGDDDLWCEDSASDGYRDDGRDRKSELDREWKRRQNQFHTIGYRDGLMAGKEASAQEGFNAGFRESVVPGYNWGLVRGIISTLSCLPDELKEKLIGRSDKRDELQALYEATHSVSSNQALMFFHDDIMNRKPLDSGPDSSGDASYCGKLESFKEKLKSVLSESPASGITATVESNIAG